MWGVISEKFPNQKQISIKPNLESCAFRILGNYINNN